MRVPRTVRRGLAAGAVVCVSAVGAAEISGVSPETSVGVGLLPEDATRIGRGTVVRVEILGDVFADGDEVILSYDIVGVRTNNTLAQLAPITLIPSAAVDGTGTSLPDGVFGDTVHDSGSDYVVDVDFAEVPGFSAAVDAAAAAVQAAADTTAAVVRVYARDVAFTTVVRTPLAFDAGVVNEGVSESPTIDASALGLVSAVYNTQATPGDTSDDTLELAFSRPLFLEDAVATGDNPSRGNGTADGPGGVNRPGLDELLPSDFELVLDGVVTPVTAVFDADAAGFANAGNAVVRVGIDSPGNLMPGAGVVTELRIAGAGVIRDYLRSDAAGLTAVLTLDTGDPECTAADVDGSGAIGLGDLLELLANFGTPGPVGDIDGDGSVELADLLTLLSRFGDVCP